VSTAFPLRAEHLLAPYVARLAALDDVDAPIVVGCSGGADSLALLALVRAAGHETCAVYVDHGLRAGALDHDVVEAAAARFGAGFRRASVEVAPGGNLEARARDERYAALVRVAAEVGTAIVAVAHTRDDQAETVLLNVLRGSAMTGLAGMPAARGAIRRPLLGFRRAETREICSLLRLAPVHDVMNDDRRFRRVWLRREVIPRLERDAQRDLVEVLARQAELLRDDDEYLDALAAALVEPGMPLDAARLTAAPIALGRRAVRLWLGAPPPSLDQVNAVLDVAGGGVRAVQLSGGERIERAAGRLHRLGTTVDPPAPARCSLPGHAEFGQFALDAWIESGPPVAWPDGRHTAVFDADRLGPEVSVRSPESGDRFHPIGRAASLLVADALRLAGVPASARAARPVVCTPERKVCWVVGYRIDDHVKVTARTRRFLWMSVESVPSTASDQP
jgi:tRNA(Ile)-lysidine synthase